MKTLKFQRLCVVSLSGGMDSGTMLAITVASQRFEEVIAVSFIYGSKHNPYEMEKAFQLCEHLGVERVVIDLAAATKDIKSNLLKSGGKIPEGHYEAESMSQTVVPGRNIIFISHAIALAWSRSTSKNEQSIVQIGIHQGDHAVYPDCRPEFFYDMDRATRMGTDGRVILEAPFLGMNKISILAKGVSIDMPYAMTRTCYKDQKNACGKCGACQERLEAFRLNQIEDPIKYEYRGELAKS